MMARGGRDKSFSDQMNRFEEKDRRSGWGIAPPSRQLWVGNLNPHVSQNAIAEQFSRFGRIDNISYMPGRNYAFVNFKKEDDAIVAMRGLQGSVLAGCPLRIEFAKGDKPSVPARDNELQKHNEERYSIDQEVERSRRDLRGTHENYDGSYEKNKENKNSEPSEVLWVGFPPFLNAEEVDLRRAFSPFGEIEGISTFPGRNYAFVRYRSVYSACRAKEALQGKLFNNPRVRICFSRNEFASADQERSLRNPSFSSHSRLLSNLDDASADASFKGYGRSNFVQSSTVPGSEYYGAFGHDRAEELGSERRMSEDIYECYRNSPRAETGGQWHDIPFERPRRTPLYEDSWGMDDGSFRIAKKLKADCLTDKDLPEYPFSDLEQKRHYHPLPKLFPNLADSGSSAYNRGFDSVNYNHKGISDYMKNPLRPLAESDESPNTFDRLDAGPGPLVANKNILHRLSSEPHQPSPIEEWKWEGTIAKGGTFVCRARCFPVGKVLDFMLPDVLNCTAKTDLDMLAKHYYQAAGSWVVFFVPENDDDIASYNEFLNYLGEKQRAAVAKLGERGTLFLVPPSDFSVKVLKVPGKLSISGVILKFQQPISKLSSTHNPLEGANKKLLLSGYQPKDTSSLSEDALSRIPYSPEYKAFSQGENLFSLPSGPGNSVFSPLPPMLPPLQRNGDTIPLSGSVTAMDRLSEYSAISRRDQFRPQHSAFLQPKLSNQMHISSSIHGGSSSPSPNTTLPLNSNSTSEMVANTSVTPLQSASKYAPETITGLPSGKFSLQPEQLVQLSEILGRSTGKESELLVNRENKQGNLPTNSNKPVQSSTLHGSQIGQGQQFQQPVPPVVPTSDFGQQGNQQAANNSHEDTEDDAQKRLQATLQLAATLLQQIQHQSKTGDRR